MILKGKKLFYLFSVIGAGSLFATKLSSFSLTNEVMARMFGNFDGSFYDTLFLTTGSSGNAKNNKIWSERHDDVFSPKEQFRSEWITSSIYSPDFRQFPEKEKQIYQMIWDHTIKLSMPCQSGTGWILDFELPTDGKYPTKWFVATNMHVLNNFRFQDNSFDQVLPIGLDEVFRSPRRENYDSYSYLKESKCRKSLIEKNPALTLYKEAFAKKKENKKNSRFLNEMKQFFGFDFSDWIDDDNNNSQEENERYYYVADVPKPKLFYAATDFLGPRYTKSGHEISVPYHRDFAILELNFATQTQAKSMTANFYEKYTKRNTHSSNQTALKGVDLFMPELMKNKTHKDLYDMGNFYFGGYPGGEYENLSFEVNSRQKRDGTFTKSELTHLDSRVSIQDELFPLKNQYNQTIFGHIDLNKLDSLSDAGKLNWNNKLYRNWGYAYALSNAFLMPGSSGSMVVNSDGRLLGLYRMYNSMFNDGFVEPIRSEGIVENGKIILPKFDLIAGVEGQKSSYKSQLSKYYPNMNTYLKQQQFKSA